MSLIDDMFGDDTKLRIVFWFIVGFILIATIGVWEYVIQPLYNFIATRVSIGL